MGEAWEDYASRIEKRESVLETMSVSVVVSDGFDQLLTCALQERDKYMTIYAHYLRDEAHSEITKAIHAGRAIP